MVSRPRFRHKTMLVTGGPGFKLRSVFKQKILSKYLYFNLIMPKGKNKTLFRKSPLASQSFLSEYKALTLKPETRLSRLLSWPAYYRVLGSAIFPRVRTYLDCGDLLEGFAYSRFKSNGVLLGLPPISRVNLGTI